jgi:hypothetical protein
MHPDFASWTEMAPDGWTIVEGARPGDGPESAVRQGNPGFLLEVTAEHRV